MAGGMGYALSMAEKVDKIVNKNSAEFNEKANDLSREVELIDKSVADMRDGKTPSIRLLPRTAAGKLSALQQGIAKNNQYDDIRRVQISKKDYDGISRHFGNAGVYIFEEGGLGSTRGPAGLHSHEHKDNMVVHQDKHNPKTAPGVMAHSLTEGIPAAMSFLKKDIGPKGMSDEEYNKLVRELDFGKML